MNKELKHKLDLLYTGRSKRSVRFRYALIAFDFATILYFVATMPFPDTPLIRALNLVIGLLIALDLAARFWISHNRGRLLGRVYVIADLLVLGSVVLDSVFAVDLSFLRVLRGLRLVDSFELLRDLRHRSHFFRKREDLIVAIINLTVFILFCTSAVFTFFASDKGGHAAYVDALYFTVTTLTTTGYGDITPETPTGKLAAVAMMIVGVSLFVRLARALFVQSKVHFVCKTCGLSRHDHDAVHCKHCGAIVRIETTGAD